MKKVIALTLMALCLSSCTDVQRSKLTALGSPHTITCWNYSTMIYMGTSTGRVSSESDSISFEDKQTRELVEIQLGQSTSCVIKVMP